MSTCLAEVIFGHNDRDHGGIQFNNRISVYENSVTRLVFEKRASREGNPGSITAIWIPNPNYLLESCILMSALYGLDNSKLKEMTDQVLPKAENDFDVNLCDVDEHKLLELFAESKKLFCPQIWTDKHGHNIRWKFIFVLFQGSSLERDMPRLLDYEMDVEVTKSVYYRHYSEWSQGISEWGAL